MYSYSLPWLKEKRNPNFFYLTNVPFQKNEFLKFFLIGLQADHFNHGLDPK